MSNLLLKNAEFETSSPDLEHLPDYSLPEFAFLGRSNVGKSSLINLVCGQKRLAHTSSTPGRTRLLNYFRAILQNSTSGQREEIPIGIVDLPGVGYAKMSKSEKENLSNLLAQYIQYRPQITAVFHLVDARREPSMEDKSLSDQLRNLNPDYFVVATKVDKLGKAARKSTLVGLAQFFDIRFEDVVATSTTEKFGQHDIWERMWKLASPQ